MEKYTSKSIDHLGLVARMCDEIGLVAIIDELIRPDKRSKLSTGECAKLMIINGLGFTSRPLYLEAQFYSSKPIARLLGRELGWEEITDDSLGRGLDRLFLAGCEAVFSHVVSKAVDIFKVDRKFRSLDTTSMSVRGEYGEGLGLVEFGYSKDQRPDLKQFMISLMSSQDGDVPLLAQTIAGNSSDKKHFREVLNKLQSEIKQSDKPFYYLADSALYTKQTIEEISGKSKWITRVSESLTESKQAIRSIRKEEMIDFGEGYYAKQVKSNYAGIEQRWMVVFSQKRYDGSIKTVEKQVKKGQVQAQKAVNKLGKKVFHCQEDAQKAVEELSLKLAYHTCKQIEIKKEKKLGKVGRPKSTDKGQEVYKIGCQLEESAEKIGLAKQSKGKFIVATNELDEAKLSQEELVSRYKKQQSVERGFRFLKDPFFMTSSVFLKNERRIVALGMIMCLCLLVYMLAQRMLRLNLEEHKESLPNQNGKPTNLPTMRWIYQIFEGVHILYQASEQDIGAKPIEIVLNLTPLRIKILQLFGPSYEKLYQNVS
jgi:transposase